MSITSFSGIRFQEKETAKALGAKFNFKDKMWFAPNAEVKEKLIAAGFTADETNEEFLAKIALGHHPCSKCRKWFPEEEFFVRKNCKCRACLSCVEKLKIASHVFFCERYAYRID